MVTIELCGESFRLIKSRKYPGSFRLKDNKNYYLTSGIGLISHFTAEELKEKFGIMI